jgi:RNA polymerase sigma-70 factor (ECF subfamily)
VATRISGLKHEAEGGYAALDDRLLVLDFQAGDPEAFVEIHRRYVGLSRHVCLRILSDRDEADEAVQETWIRVFRGLHRFNGRYALQPWISKIATNVAVDVTRSRARRPQLADRPLIVGTNDIEDDPVRRPDETVERQLDIDLVHEVLASLPTNHRRALMLREFEGRSHGEIGDALGVTPSQAKALIHRAKKSFRAAWEKAGGPAALRALAAPFLLFGKVCDHVRRFVDRAHEAGQAAVGQASTQVGDAVQTVASVGSSAPHIGDRVVAGAVSLLLAGGVTAGAVVVNRHQGRHPVDRATPVVEAAPTQTSVAPTTKHARRNREQPPKQLSERLVRPKRDNTREAPAAAPSPDVDASVTTDASPTPAPTESPEPSPTPGAVIKPAPAFAFGFSASTQSVLPCDCADSTLELVSSHLDGDVTEKIVFDQSIKGVATDADGQQAWPFSFEVSGSADKEMGEIHVTFVLTSPSGPSSYEATAYLNDRRLFRNRSVKYSFDGHYDLREGQEAMVGMPTSGRIDITLGVWPDETLYKGSVSLSDAAA